MQLEPSQQDRERQQATWTGRRRRAFRGASQKLVQSPQQGRRDPFSGVRSSSPQDDLAHDHLFSSKEELRENPLMELGELLVRPVYHYAYRTRGAGVPPRSRRDALCRPRRRVRRSFQSPRLEGFCRVLPSIHSSLSDVPHHILLLFIMIYSHPLRSFARFSLWRSENCSCRRSAFVTQVPANRPKGAQARHCPSGRAGTAESSEAPRRPY